MNNEQKENQQLSVVHNLYTPLQQTHAEACHGLFWGFGNSVTEVLTLIVILTNMPFFKCGIHS